MSLGPGRRSMMVPEAQEALERAEIIVGYKTYLEFIPDFTAGKTVVSSGMKRELDRCLAAIDQALAGHRVALVSSGDAGVYGMAGLVFDLCRERGLHPARSLDDSPKADLVVRVIAGVSALNAAASAVGAPLMHDFAAISLSDHLTGWEIIEKRLDAAAAADFVLAIYNPRSKTRPGLLEQARDILLRHRPPNTPVAIVCRAMRDGQWHSLTNLGQLPCEQVDMQSVVIVGNSHTYVWQGWMVTPRGYLDKYSLDRC